MYACVHLAPLWTRCVLCGAADTLPTVLVKVSEIRWWLTWTFLILTVHVYTDTTHNLKLRKLNIRKMRKANDRKHNCFVHSEHAWCIIIPNFASKFYLSRNTNNDQRRVSHLLTFDLTCCSHTSQPRQPIEMKCRQETSHVTLRALGVWPSNNLDERKLKKNIS